MCRHQAVEFVLPLTLHWVDSDIARIVENEAKAAVALNDWCTKLLS